MQDKLEDFFNDNRDGFDLYKPSEKVWLSVKAQLQHKNRRIRRTYYAAAACALLIIVSFSLIMRHEPNKIMFADNVQITIPDVNDTETYYAAIIEKQRAQLEQFSKTYPDVFKDFAGEIDTLHLLYGQLKIEYKNSNGNEAVLQAMIENLRTQVQLLNRQMQVILTVKQQTNKRSQKKC